MKRQRSCGALGLSILVLAGLLTGQARAAIVPGDFDKDCDADCADLSARLSPVSILRWRSVRTHGRSAED